MFKLAVIVFGVLAVAQAQRAVPRGRSIDNERVATTPVPILRQINKVNEDGSYTYGYESADGSYKVETKTKEGEVQGKYGYYDDTGALREIEYGASRQGFNPSGTGIRSPSSAPAMSYDPIDDSGFYDPERYDRPFAYNRNTEIVPEQQQQTQVRRPASGRRPGSRRPKQQQNFAQFEQNYAPAPQPQQQQQQVQHQHVVNYQSAPQPAPQPQQQQYYQPPPQNYYQAQPTAPPFSHAQQFHGHPARNIDINTGSYSVNYSG
ncbi:Endocuticle structural glycoprotein SgAbd-8 [Orchesella cincta]|uniref:Endocuticle structural glycoprotein SgAbd-8 n=1 Tax=Orchesella cincta TaxID=48709 RepID=A0A1D2MWE5_ORCCI|nr:Endocuticle structural glycoprotein SgAbd-8 [Orchesella cincta]